MPPEKRNKFLDVDESEDDQQSENYDSEAEVRKGSRSAKRRKLDDASDDSSSGDESQFEDDLGDDDKAGHRTSDDDQAGPDTGTETASTGDGAPKPKKPKLPEVKTSDPLRSLVKKNRVVTEEAIRKSGVLYISRIPPFMKPHKLRTLLEPFGPINRTYLAPEDPTSHARRVRAGGNKKRMFTEGWVEFVDKKDAKKAYELLNARTIGGKKGSYYRDDVWSLVYLKGFKWRDLTAQIEKENAEREIRMKAEIRKATRENLEFVRNVEKAKELDGIKAKRDKKGQKADEGEKKARVFKQTPKVTKDDDTGERPDNVKRVLNKIF